MFSRLWRNPFRGNFGDRWDNSHIFNFFTSLGRIVFFWGGGSWKFWGKLLFIKFDFKKDFRLRFLGNVTRFPGELLKKKRGEERTTWKELLANFEHSVQGLLPYWGNFGYIWKNLCSISLAMFRGFLANSFSWENGRGDKLANFWEGLLGIFGKSFGYIFQA